MGNLIFNALPEELGLNLPETLGISKERNLELKDLTSEVTERLIIKKQATQSEYLKAIIEFCNTWEEAAMCIWFTGLSFGRWEQVHRDMLDQLASGLEKAILGKKMPNNKGDIMDTHKTFWEKPKTNDNDSKE